MSDSVSSFSVEYNPINKDDIFTGGDHITGRITLELAKDCKINSVCVKLKGKAEVKWTEMYGQTVITYQKKEKYFSVKKVTLQQEQGNTVGPGNHVYPFTFQIPAQDLPSSFRGSLGKIVYKLEANLSRPMRIDSKAKAHITLISKRDLNSDSELMIAQRSFIDKKMKLFTSGTVVMDANIARTGFHQGEGIQVVASIQNRSSRDVQPKYTVCIRRAVSLQRGKRKVKTKDILNEGGGG